MGIFSTSSPYDQYVEQATSEANTSENWTQIMEICDKVKESSSGSKECIKSITRRLNNENPRVVLQTIVLLDACINNCGKDFLLEVASREFEQEIKKLLTSTKTHHKVSEELRKSLKKWAEGEFKGNPQLDLIPSLYNKLKQEGYEFNIQTDSPKKTVKYSTDPNVVNSKQEEDDIARAIQLSLQSSKENGDPSRRNMAASSSSGLYASASAALNQDFTPSMSGEGTKEPLKVRAIYDFEAAEDNELTFKAGEIIVVIDNSDPNWWKGSNHRSEGLFPANFVTTDLNSDASKPEGKRVSFSESVEVTELEGDVTQQEEVSGDIDEEKIDTLMHTLHEADPTGERPDDPTLTHLEECVNAMAPTIDAELEQIDRKHAQLDGLSRNLLDAINLYHMLMREMPNPGYYPIPNMGKMPSVPPGQMPPGVAAQPFSTSPIPGMPPHMMYPQMGQYPPYMPGPPGHPGAPPQPYMPPTSVPGAPPHMQPPPPGMNPIQQPPGPHMMPPHMQPASVPQGVPVTQGPPGPQGPPVTTVPQSMVPPGMPVQHGMPPQEFSQAGPVNTEPGSMMPTYGHFPPAMNGQFPGMAPTPIPATSGQPINVSGPPAGPPQAFSPPGMAQSMPQQPLL